MDAWKEMADSAFEAATTMRDFPRSCVSRAYYAAYSIVTHRLQLTKGVNFPLDRDGPRHADVPDLIQSHLIGRGKLSVGDCKIVKAALRRLYAARCDADYNPRRNIDIVTIRTALLDAKRVITILSKN